MEFRLIALDMDGTALAPDGAISPATDRAISRALEAGVHVVFCSGRCTAELKPLADQFPAMRYAICENGSYTIDLHSGECVDHRGLTPRLVEEILAEGKNHDVLIQIGVGGKFYMQDWTLDRLEDFGMERFRDLLTETARFIPDLENAAPALKGPVGKINFYCKSWDHRKEVLDSVRRRNLPLNYANGVAWNIEMASVDAGKDAGLAALCAHLKIPMEQVIAVGDGGNDIPMLKIAGLSVAMGNAAPEVKEIVHEETKDNAHDGVAEVIQKYILKEA